MDKLNVIIPVYKPDESFSDILACIKKQSIKPERIILMWTLPDGSSDDVKSSIEEKYADNITNIYYVNQSEFDHGGTRRLAADKADAEYILCMTQDCKPYDDLLIESLMDAIDNEAVAAAYARQIPYDNCNEAEKIVRRFNYPDEERIQNKDSLKKYGIKTYFCSNVCAIYRKSAYNSVGGFVEKTIFNEDMIMAAGLVDNGYSIKYAAKAKVYHSHNYTCMQQFRRNFDLAVSHKQYYDIFSRVSSESEGIKMVITVVKKLLFSRFFYLIPMFIINSGYKYMGYRKGLNYENMSRKKVLKYTMNRSYWS
ncbi:MAG: glycosyltransferase [Lachnospiraceae bacterium]|nr:glycosyltransferase [Lachnospiraceae bacterium]